MSSLAVLQDLGHLMAEPQVPDFRRYLALIALFGAARKTATPAQLDDLKLVAARLRERSEDQPLRSIVEALFKVMGPEWNPLEVESFGPWLDQLLREIPRGADVRTAD